MKAYLAVVATFGVSAFFSSAHAQPENFDHEAGIRISALSYQGDLTPAYIGYSGNVTAGFGFFGTKILSNKFSIRINFDYNRLKGSDSKYSQPGWRPKRSFSFEASAVELSGHFIYSINGNYNENRLIPYVFGGVSLALLNVNRDTTGFNTAYFQQQKWVTQGLKTDLATTPPNTLLVFPVGAGFKYLIGERFSLFTEVSYRLMETDYLDGFSKSGDIERNDHYSNISVGFIFRIGTFGIRCPMVR